jgi:hypothetical protein
MYKQLWNGIIGAVRDDMILRLPDNAYIPFDPANTDYQEYLKWVAEGNTPLPADE